jgi:UPF0176 protein
MTDSQTKAGRARDLPLSVFTFYKFIRIAEVQIDDLKNQIQKLGESHLLEGLVIFGREGINATISGALKDLTEFMDTLEKILEVEDFGIKISPTDFAPFKKFRVKVRDEIVSLGKPDIRPTSLNNHLTPEEWNQAMLEADVVVLDTRNWYETKVGKFAGAIDPGLSEFNKFPEYLKESEIPKNKKVLIYCTGGIRCEKAIFEMQAQGFQKVFQLEGGILKYIEKFPNQKFEGECFVFDHRVAVDQDLKPTEKFKMCPHCGQPSGEKLSCRKCDLDAWVCEECAKEEHKQTCSKNCSYHYQREPSAKGKKQFQGHRFDVIKKRSQIN